MRIDDYYKAREKETQDRIALIVNNRKVWELLRHNTPNAIRPWDLTIDLDAYAWPGGYPVYYVTNDSGVLCPKCANENLELLSDCDDPQWYVIGCDTNEDDDNLYCDNCNDQIASAYGADDFND